MDYPQDFPAESRAKVEVARIRAGRRFDSDKVRAKWRSEIETFFWIYVLTPFVVFASESSRLGLWPVDKMDQNCREFLRLLTINAYHHKGRTAGLRNMICNWDGSILPEAQQEIEKTPQWRKYENIRLKFAVKGRPTAQGTGINPSQVASRVPEPGNHFGISTDVLSEIEDTVYNHLDSEALAMEFLPVWKELSQTNPFSPAELPGGAKQLALAEIVAREAAARLRPLFNNAASEYAELLTRTILEHRRTGDHKSDYVHWSTIADQSIMFCAKLAEWEKSARWLYGPLKATGLDWKDASPRTRVAYLTALSAWMLIGPRALPSLSNDQEAEGISDLLRRTIRNIVRLSPEKNSLTKAPILSSESGTSGMHASSSVRDTKPMNERRSLVLPILTRKGWSILDWAKYSDVDFHTANNYLKGRTNPYKSTRKKLANALGIDVNKFPS